VSFAWTARPALARPLIPSTDNKFALSLIRLNDITATANPGSLICGGMTAERDGGVEARNVRTRVLDAAFRLIAAGGIAALTTRAVAAEASIQAPTLYRLFGDKRGLLAAVAEHGQAKFIAEKVALAPHPDPVQSLANAWDGYVDFSLANPAIFAIMNEPRIPTAGVPATAPGLAILYERVERIAQAGRLRVPVSRAVALIHAAGVGTVMTLLAIPEEERDPQLSPMARDSVMATIVGDTPRREGADRSTLAVGLRAHLGEDAVLTPGERLLLIELLDRLA